jgi:hypothetical protein
VSQLHRLHSTSLSSNSRAWHAYKYIDPAESGAVLPILHANGFEISERTIFGTMDDCEIISLFRWESSRVPSRFVLTKPKRVWVSDLHRGGFATLGLRASGCSAMGCWGNQDHPNGRSFGQTYRQASMAYDRPQDSKGTLSPSERWSPIPSSR